MGVTKIGYGLAVAFDCRASSWAGAGEIVFGSFELMIGDVEVVTGGASMTAWRCLETTVCAGLAPARLDGSGFCGVQSVAVIACRCCDLDERGICLGVATSGTQRTPADNSAHISTFAVTTFTALLAVLRGASVDW